jgi:hypothetical protein
MILLFQTPGCAASLAKLRLLEAARPLRRLIHTPSPVLLSLLVDPFAAREPERGALIFVASERPMPIYSS